MDHTILLRLSLAFILMMHSIPSIISGDINSFGKDYLDGIGFFPFGIYIAWMVKLIHVFSIFCLVANRFLKITAIANILIFIVGIILIHGKEGWFVVGGGRNGVEFSLLLIMCFLSVAFPKEFLHFKKKNAS
ncbi:hypothetical protein CHRYSEOSP005_10870 [Chryseobacterium sp. Alg-005]|uniref:DoxX family protein n=1 Tax=Chryseobacterium sp. Alg-005 TaxID=3159516 RepID=UPI00355584A9